MSDALEARNLTRILPGPVATTLIDDISVGFAPGTLTAITGPSGSGKSSLLYLLGLLDVPTRGDIAIDGISTADLDGDGRAYARLRQFGFVFQFHFLLPELSVLDNVTLPMAQLGGLSAGAMRARGTALLASLGMADCVGKLPSELSGGQQQRTAIARALANDPRFILADEPTGALDTRNGAAVFAILRALAREGRTVIVVTHDQGLAATADHQIRLVDGRVVGDIRTLPEPRLSAQA